MKKRILSILLTLCMVLMLVPTTVFAADDVGGLNDLLSVLNKGGTQKLNKDYVIDQRTISVGKSITIDLNGHVIRFNGGRFNVGYKGKENITLTIKDSNPKATHSGQFEGLPDGGVITSSYGGTYGGAVKVCYEKCTFNLEGGTIYNCKADTGGCVYIDAGTFNMKGGTIDSCTATDDCGAVCLSSNNSIFNMTGGTIKNCKSTSTKNSLGFGGGVYVQRGTFTMTDGTIENCETLNIGGGVAVSSRGTFNMKGGTINNCSADYGGGVNTHGTFNMTGGTIDNCSAKSNGGGVCHESTDAGAASFTMTDGTIKNCSAENGGGVATVQNFKDLTFTMTGGTIDNCSAKIFGGGMCIEKNGDCTLEGGTINNCSADYGGGVFVKRGDFIMKSGTIKNCFARTSVGSYGYGGGINTYYSTFTMTGGTVKDCASTYSENDTLCLFANSTMTADGGSINGTTIIYSLNSTISKIKNTSPDKYTKFYGVVENKGQISGGVYYGGIQNKGSGTVTNPYKIVTFDSNGGSSVPNQWLVNAKGATANRPTNPTWEGYKFMGWYNGNTVYDFTTAVPDNIKIFTLKAKWVNSRVSTEAELKEAINAGITSIKLVGDFKLSSILGLSDKDITLDLNGHTLTGDIKLNSNNLLSTAKLTLIDSNPTATHTDSNLPLGGVLDGDIKLDIKTFGISSLLCANGGTVMGQVTLNDSYTQIVCTSTTPTAFMDSVEGSGEIHGGMFYGGVKTSCIEEAAVAFKNDGKLYAVEVVKYGSKAVPPVSPEKDGYVFAGWYNGSTKYDFTQTVINDITLTDKWVNEVNSEETLRAAINEGITTIKLMNDIKLSSALDLSLKNITIDLNGHVISGADISINTGNGKANLTLKDSNPKATHDDSTLPSGGVVTSKISMKQSGGKYNDCVLYANGGTVTSEFNTNTNAVAIKCTSNTPTAFTGKISGYTHLYGGIYYGTIASNVTIEGKKITFLNGDDTYAYEIVDSGNNTVAPISPPIKEGYNGIDGWYNGDTKYTFGSSLSQDITLTAKYKNPITYSIIYYLNDGTATPANPTSYTVESENITLNNPKKTGYTFIGWRGADLIGNNNMTVTIPKGSTGLRIYVANYSLNKYTVKFDTNGGTNISDKTGVVWRGNVLYGITNPTKDGWEFTGWKYGNKTVNAYTTYNDLVTDDTTESITLVAQWKDIGAPTGEISIGTDSWTDFLNTITFGVFFKDTQKVTITANDNSGEAVKIEYLISDKALDDLEKASFTAYTEAFSIKPDNKYVIYAKLTDASGNVKYLSSEGIVLDAASPVISGIENGKTYCEAQTVTVTEDYIKSVKVNGTEVTLDANNQFTLPAKGKQTIVVTDKAGNETSLTVTVNEGHTAGEDDGDCSTPVYCINHPNIIVIKAKSHDFTGELLKDKTQHWHECRNEGCNQTDKKIAHSGSDDGDCTTAVICECGATVKAAETSHSWSKWTKDEGADTHTHKCQNADCKVSETKSCTGGTATCTAKAECEYCGEEYGEKDSNKHTGSKVWTTTATQHKQYWDCCDALVVNYQDHTWSNGVCSVCDYTCVHKDKNPIDHKCDICEATLTECKDENPIDHKCDICGAKLTECKDKNPIDHKCDICGATLTECKDENPRDHKCDICGTKLSDCKDEKPIDHKCDICGATLSVCKDEDPIDHKCDICGTKLSDCNDKNPIDHKCDICGATLTECKDKNPIDHKCDICGIKLSDCKDENPIDHKCDICGTKLSDCNDKNPIDHKCDICGATLSVCKDEDPIDHKCDICGELISDSECKDENPKDHKCDTCGATLSKCKDENPVDHKCDICGTKLSDCNDKNPIDHKCDICGATLTECKDKNPIDHKCDICGATLTECKDENPIDHKCDICGATLTECKDENPAEHKCDICGATLTECKDENPIDHKCDICGATLTDCNDKNPIDHKCDICGATLTEHSGGEATCTKKAICEVCGEPYGELDSSNHNLENIPEKDATVTEVGNKEYWHCLNCGKYFSDKDGKNGIELKDTVIAKLSPEIIDGKGQTVTEGEKKDLTFRSNAAFSDFIRVELDGKILDEKNYTVKEGSTVVTLKADYVATLSVGKHTIGIVSENGTASTTLTVNEKMVDNNEKTVNNNVNTVDNNTKSPQTGDNRHIALWIALLFVSGGAVIGTTAVSKKRKHSKN